jgi:transposase
MEDILDLYERPLDRREPVVCLDERPVCLHSEKRSRRQAKPGKPTRYDYEYVREGTANVFCAIEPLAGKHITKVTRSRKGSEFAKMLADLSRRYPKARTIHLVVDNLSTHSRTSLVAHFGEPEGSRLWSRFTIHYTPKHGSWLNQAELEIGLMSKQCLGTRRIDSFESLRAEVNAWNRDANRRRVTVSWKFTAADARRKFRYAGAQDFPD